MKQETILSTFHKWKKPAAMAICVALAITFIVLTIHEVGHDCQYRHAPPYSSIISKLTLTKDGAFMDADARLVAETIYSYRSQFLYSAQASDIGVFQARRPKEPYAASALTDMSLYKLTTCSALVFSKMMAFAYVFNNPNYIKCINAFDHSSKQFAEVEPGRTTKDVIIKDILKLNDADVEELKRTLQENIDRSKKVLIAEKVVQSMMDTLGRMTDEQLYRLITDGTLA